MPLIQRIRQLQGRGLEDEEIIRQLGEQGFTPKEINEAIEQSQIKAAVSDGQEGSQTSESPGMQPSVLSPSEETNFASSQLQQTTQGKKTQYAEQAPRYAEQAPRYAEQAPEQYAEQAPEQYAEQAPEQYAEQAPRYAEPLYQEQYTEQPYPETLESQQIYPEPQYPVPYPGQTQEQYPYSEYPQQASDTNIISEIAEQIVAEKLQKIQNQITDTIKFKTETEIRVTDLNERLRRIELIIDRLQSSILGKIGGYEKDISNLKQEISTTQDSFSKVLPPLTKPSELKTPKKPTHKPAHQEHHHKKSDALAHYLRR